MRVGAQLVGRAAGVQFQIQKKRTRMPRGSGGLPFTEGGAAEEWEDGAIGMGMRPE